MTQSEKYIYIAETFDTLTTQAEQLYALSRLIEDVNAFADKDIHSLQSAMWLLSSLPEEHSKALLDLHKNFLSQYHL